jgi:hypothetical protein
MENWDHDIVYQLVAAEHQERIARDVAAQRLAESVESRPVRARLAAALVAFAARLPHRAASSGAAANSLRIAPARSGGGQPIDTGGSP